MTTEQKDVSLKVAEALGKDAGRGLARIDPADMERLGVQVGEVIEIKGKRRTVAKAMPAFREARGKKLIQIDGIIRANAGVGLDDKVEVRAVACGPATRVVLAPVGSSPFVGREKELAYVGRLLEGLPVVAGDQIRALLFGSRYQDFTVVSTTPADVVVLQPTTQIHIQEGKREEGKGIRVSYEDIGGLGGAVQKIREMVELPLRYPQIFDKLGIEPPKGVLLHGPPGTGKTLLARAVANETEAYFTHLSGPEVMCVGAKTPIYVDKRLISAEELYGLLRRDAETVHRGDLRETIKPRRVFAVKSIDANLKITDGTITEATQLTADAYEVELENGTCLTVSANQPFAALDSEGQLTWTMVKNLREGDWVAVAGCFETETTFDIEWTNQLDGECVYATLSETCAQRLWRSKVKLKELIGKPKEELQEAVVGIELWTNRGNESRAKPIKPVWYMSVALGRFLGGMVAEGSISKRLDEVCYSNNNRQLQQEYAEYFVKLFGVDQERVKIRREKVYVHSVPLSHLLNRVFGLPIGRKTNQLHVPTPLFSAPAEAVSAFLSGLFDGDGTPHVYHGYPSPRLFSKDPTFLREIQVLLMSRLSVPSSVSPFPTPYGQMYALSIESRHGRQKFLEAIAPSSCRFKPVELPERSGKGVGEDIVPVASLLKRIKHKLHIKYGKEIPESSVEPYISGRIPLTRRKLSQLSALLKEFGHVPEFEQIDRLLNSDVFFTRVKRVMHTGKQVLYDFGVAPHPNFLAGLPLVPLHNSKWYGESERHLREIFEDARRHAPAIIFIDELDAIAPKREEMGGEKQVERRVVAQLLALMDGLEGRGKVIVIAATNLPNLLDPALRRPGRFDRELEIGIPDARARLEILEIHTRGMPLAEDVQLPRLSEVTHGFTGADLTALAREAAMTALRRIMPRIDFAEELPYELLLDLKVTMEDFLSALKEIEPSAIREVFVEVPNVGWEDVGGLKEIKQQLIEAVEWPLKHGSLFQHAGTRPPKGILLCGPPGTGKTLLVKALASEMEVNFIAVKGPELLSKYIGESERGVREVFKKARQAAPTILFLDELDALAPARGWGGDAHVTERVVSQILTEMDGIEELKGVLVVAATNRLDLVDPALRRPGRFDLLLELPLPDADSRLEILKVHTRNRPVEKELDLSRLAEQTEGLSGAELEWVCNRATLLAIREFLAQGGGDEGALVIRAYHFQKALEEITKAAQVV